MKKRIIHFCLSLLLIGCFQIDGKEENLTVEDYSTMSSIELDAAFVSAVKERHLQKVQELIHAGANIDTLIFYIKDNGDCYWSGEITALEYAILDNNLNMVKLLIKKEKKLDEFLMIAIKNHNLDIIKEIISEGADVNYIDKRKNTPLTIATNEGYSSIVEELIKNGADVNYIDKNENTPLIIAAGSGNAIEITKILLKAGAKVNHVDKYGKTALMEAVREHDLNTVQALLEVPEIHKDSFFGFGTKPINYADKDGNTALILAIKYVRCGYVDNREYNICVASQNIIKLLLETPGIDVHHVNKEGETAVVLLKEIEKRYASY